MPLDTEAERSARIEVISWEVMLIDFRSATRSLSQDFWDGVPDELSENSFVAYDIRLR